MPIGALCRVEGREALWGKKIALREWAMSDDAASDDVG